MSSSFWQNKVFFKVQSGTEESTWKNDIRKCIIQSIKQGNNLNERLARKEKKYLDRSQQLDLVIVVDRLLIGFDDVQIQHFRI